MTRRWAAFIDESGNYDRKKDCCVVCAVLVEYQDEDELEARARHFESELRARFPELGWPPHASPMNTAASWLFWQYGLERERFEPLYKHVFEALLEDLTHTQKRLLAEAIHRGEDLPIQERKALYKLTSKLPDAQRDLLEHFASNRRVNFESCQRVASSAAHLLFSTDQDVRGPLLLAHSDRYASQLVGLFERLRDVLGAARGWRAWVQARARARQATSPGVAPRVRYSRDRPAARRAGDVCEVGVWSEREQVA